MVPMDVAGRLGRLRPMLESASCDALLVTNLTNVRYLTGFTGSAAMLLVRSSAADVLFTDGRYTTQSREQLAAAGVGAEVVIGNVAEQQAALAKAVGSSGRLG